MPGESNTSTSNRRSPLAFFLLTALLFIPLPVLGAFVHVPGMPKNAPVTDLAAAFTPAAAALILTFRAEGAAGATALLKRVFDYDRIRRKVWYLPILLLEPVILLSTYGFVALTGVTFQPQPTLSLTAMLLLVPVFFVLAAGEELGWSGYATDPLQQRWGALGGSLVLGVVWWAFHIPSILQSGQDTTLITLGAFATVGLRVLYVWIFNNAGGSVFAIIVVHTIGNICASYVPSLPTSAAGPVIVVLAVAVNVVWGAKTLTHHRFARHHHGAA